MDYYFPDCPSPGYPESITRLLIAAGLDKINARLHLIFINPLYNNPNLKFTKMVIVLSNLQMPAITEKKRQDATLAYKF